MKNQVVLEYVPMVGAGAFFKGVPANHITEGQLEHLATKNISEDQLVSSGLYENYNGPVIMPEALTNARELGVPLDRIQGTGPDGIIQPWDVRVAKKNMQTAAVVEPPQVGTDAALELMAEYGINPDQIQGTGTGGKITKPDVEAYMAANQEMED